MASSKQRSSDLAGSPAVLVLVLATGLGSSGEAHAQVRQVGRAAWGAPASWVHEATLFASDAGEGPGGEFFGWSGAHANGFVLVGAWGDSIQPHGAQGSAYVFTRDGDAWIEVAKLVASDGFTFDALGLDVAISGSTAVVGAPCHPVLGCEPPGHPGAVYVFDGDDGWTEQAKLVSSDGVVGDGLGWSVAVDGDTIVAGARFATVDGNSVQGAAYVFVRTDEAWTEQSKLVASDGAALDSFGVSVAISGEDVVVGLSCSGGAGCQGASPAGAAYVFARDGEAWTEQAKLVPADGEGGDAFGETVALSGDTVLVGAPFANVDGDADRGATYVFERTGDAWSEEAALVASDGSPAALFGQLLVLSGDVAVIGAPRQDRGAGAAYVFERTGDVWTEEMKLSAPDESLGRVEGPLALTADLLLLGSAGTMVNGLPAGAALVYVADEQGSTTGSDTSDGGDTSDATETGSDSSTSGSGTTTAGPTGGPGGSGSTGVDEDDTSGGGGADGGGCGCRTMIGPVPALVLPLLALAFGRRSRRRPRARGHR